MQDLLDSCKRDPATARLFIKYEVLQKKPIFDSYKTFCQTLGDDTMDYQEFEFWYWRFYNGKLDMDYDRSTDRKPLELLQLPLEMVGKVVRKLDLNDRLKIRCVSKVTRSIADYEKLKMEGISLSKLKFSLYLHIEGLISALLKTNAELGFLVQSHEPKKADRKVENEHYVTYALNSLRAIMKNPKLELERFRIEGGKTDGEFMEKTLEVLTEISDSSNIKFHVKEICVRSDNPEHVVSLLSLLKPGILKEIVLCDSTNGTEDYRSIDAITRTCQWQKAKVVNLTYFRPLDPSEIEKCAHFEDFKIRVNTISKDIVVQLKEMLLQSTSSKRCKILMPPHSALSINSISKAFGLPIRNQAVHVPIPGSDECLVFTIRFTFIYIERTH